MMGEFVKYFDAGIVQKVNSIPLASGVSSRISAVGVDSGGPFLES